MSMRTLSLVLLLLPALTHAGTILETLHRNVPANDDQKVTRTFAQDSRHFVDGKPASEPIVQTVRTESLPAATFEVPAGYTLKEPLRSR